MLIVHILVLSLAVKLSKVLKSIVMKNEVLSSNEKLQYIKENMEFVNCTILSKHIINPITGKNYSVKSVADAVNGRTSNIQVINCTYEYVKNYKFLLEQIKEQSYSPNPHVDLQNAA